MVEVKKRAEDLAKGNVDVKARPINIKPVQLDNYDIHEIVDLTASRGRRSRRGRGPTVSLHPAKMFRSWLNIDFAP